MNDYLQYYCFRMLQTNDSSTTGLPPVPRVRQLPKYKSRRNKLHMEVSY